jgi:Concanavalin A-like lectin/glucanases superfamily
MKYIPSAFVFMGLLFLGSCKKESATAVKEPEWLKQDLLAYYPFNGNLKDTSGNNYNGVPNGLVQYTPDRKGKSNGAVYFNNGEAVVNINNTIFNGDFTVSVWAQLEAFTSPYPNLIYQVESFRLEFTRDNNPRVATHYLIAPGFGTTNLCQGVANFTDWTNYVITNTSGISSLYINGAFVNKSATSRRQAGTGRANFLTIGRAILDINHFKGKMDDIRFYKRALTAEEVKYLYQN